MKATEIKKGWIINDKLINGRIMIKGTEESPEIELHVYCQLIFQPGTKILLFPWCQCRKQKYFNSPGWSGSVD